MPPILKFIGLALLFILIVGGDCQCSPNSLKIIQSRTEKTYKDKQVWSVSITNTCPCSQLDVKLSCYEFHTVQPIDPKVLIRVEGGACLINNGEALRPQQQFSFTYAYDSQFPFMFLSSRIVCP